MGLAGCQITGPDDPRTESGTHREKWDRFQNGSYTYTLVRGCFCINGGEHRVTVQDGKVTTAINQWRNEAVSAEHLQYIETIDAIFDLIEQAQLEADQIEVEYSDEGYPTQVSIDWIEQAVDDELSLSISDVRPTN
jgi:hypothetical protein